MVKISEVIYQRRHELGLTQREFAEMLDVSDKTVSRWETGATIPDSEQIPLIAAALKIKTDDLFDGDEAIKEVSKRKAEDSGKSNAVFKILSLASYLLVVISCLLLSFSLVPDQIGQFPLLISGIVIGLLSLAVFVTGDVLYSNFYHSRFIQNDFIKFDSLLCFVFINILILSAYSITFVYYFLRTDNSLLCYLLAFAYDACGAIGYFVIKKTKKVLWRKSSISLILLISGLALIVFSAAFAFWNHPVFTNLSMFMMLFSAVCLMASSLFVNKLAD